LIALCEHVYVIRPFGPAANSPEKLDYPFPSFIAHCSINRHKSASFSHSPLFSPPLLVRFPVRYKVFHAPRAYVRLPAATAELIEIALLHSIGNTGKDIVGVSADQADRGDD
jgi:hypothetical protein